MWPFSSHKYLTHSPETLKLKEFDYVVVGGGTAGCVLASRLSEDEDITVLLVERGPIVTNWKSRVPLLSVDYRPASNPSYKWSSVPLPGLGGATLQMISGKVMGGTSKVNAFLYTRSVPGEYNAWAEAGRQGWSWDDVAPYFAKSEASLSNLRGVHRGSAGPWINQHIEGEIFSRNVRETIEAAKSLGIPFIERANDPDAPAASCIRLDRTLDRQMYRHSTFDAFLPPNIVRDRKRHLFICPETIVNKVVIKSGQATGVFISGEDSRPNKRPIFISARKEVIICAGAIATPQLLMLSGVGPADHLKQHGLPVAKNLPGVGSHLQDHLGVSLVYKTPLNDTLHVLEANPFRAIWELLKYLLLGIGLFLSPTPQTAIFVLSRLLDSHSRTVPDSKDALDGHSPANVPDIEIIPIPYNVTDFTFEGVGKSHGAASYLCVALRPVSSGTVRLASTDSHDRPICDLGTMANRTDYLVMRKAIRLALELGRKLREKGYPLHDLMVPQSESDEDLDAFIRQSARTTYHYTSTCRMAPEIDMGVVDDQLRVHGVRNLRIADASVFPTIPACHTQAPTVMVAERCADFIRTPKAG